MSFYEILLRFQADGSVSGLASRSATYADGAATNIGIAQPMDFAGLAAALTDSDLAALSAALQAESNARNP